MMDRSKTNEIKKGEYFSVTTNSLTEQKGTKELNAGNVNSQNYKPCCPVLMKLANKYETSKGDDLLM